MSNSNSSSSSTTSHHAMDQVLEARRKNLLELIARLGGRGAIVTIAARLGHSWPGFISQMKAPPTRGGHRAMTEQTARAIEVAFSYPPGSFDVYPLPPEYGPTPRDNISQRRSITPPTPPASHRPPPRLTVVPHSNDALRALTEAADRAGVVLEPAKLVAALQAMEAAGRGDPAYADLVVSLMK